MANGNGYLNKPNVLIYALIALVGGGGAIGVNQKSSNKVDKVERRVDNLETNQAVILEKVTNIEEDLDEARDVQEEMLDLLRKQANN